MRRFTVTVIDHETGNEYKETLDAIKVIGVAETKHLPEFLTDERYDKDDIIANHIKKMATMPTIGTAQFEIAVKWPLEQLEGRA